MLFAHQQDAFALGFQFGLPLGPFGLPNLGLAIVQLLFELKVAGQISRVHGGQHEEKRYRQKNVGKVEPYQIPKQQSHRRIRHDEKDIGSKRWSLGPKKKSHHDEDPTGEKVGFRRQLFPGMEVERGEACREERLTRLGQNRGGQRGGRCYRKRSHQVYHQSECRWNALGKQ